MGLVAVESSRLEFFFLRKLKLVWQGSSTLLSRRIFGEEMREAGGGAITKFGGCLTTAATISCDALPDCIPIFRVEVSLNCGTANNSAVLGLQIESAMMLPFIEHSVSSVLLLKLSESIEFLDSDFFSEARLCSCFVKRLHCYSCLDWVSSLFVLYFSTAFSTFFIFAASSSNYLNLFSFAGG